MKTTIQIGNLDDGSYGIVNDNLYFMTDNIIINKNVKIDCNEAKIVIDKKSALEITHTLLDSIDLLNKDTEELIYKIEEELYGDN